MKRGKARGLEEVVTDKGYHSGALLEDWGEIGVRSYISEPQRGRRKWNGKRGQQAAVYGNSAAHPGRGGANNSCAGGESSSNETFAHVYDTGGMRRTHLRGHRNILKRLLIHVAAFNLSLILRREIGVGTPRGLQDLPEPPVFLFLCRLDGSGKLLGIPSPTPRNFPQSNGPFYRHWGINETRLEKSPFHHGLLDAPG